MCSLSLSVIWEGEHLLSFLVSKPPQCNKVTRFVKNFFKEQERLIHSRESRTRQNNVMMKIKQRKNRITGKYV